MSSRRLENVFSVTIFRLEDVLKTFWRHVLKTSSRRLEDQQMFAGMPLVCSFHYILLQSSDVLKTSWRYILKTSSRRLGGKKNVYCGYLYLTNLNVYLTNLYFTNLYLTKLRRIQNVLLGTLFIFALFWNTSSISILRIKISEIGECASKAIKTKF